MAGSIVRALQIRAFRQHLETQRVLRDCRRILDELPHDLRFRALERLQQLRRAALKRSKPKQSRGRPPEWNTDKYFDLLLHFAGWQDNGLKRPQVLDKLAKRYRVKVRGRVGEEGLRRLREETLVEDGLVLGPMDVTVESEGPKSTWLVVALEEGKNRQIRRRMADLGHEVEVLVRVAIGPLALGDLAPGAVRPLTPAEVASLRQAVS